MPKASHLSPDAANLVARGLLSPGVAFAAADAKTVTIQEGRRARLRRVMAEAKAKGQVEATVRLVDLEALICTLALTDNASAPVLA